MRYFGYKPTRLKSLIFSLTILIISMKLHAQQVLKEDSGLRAVYIVLDAGTNFQEWYGGANLKLVFNRNWVASLDYFQGSIRTAKYLPNDFTNGANLLGMDETPKDFLDSYSVLFGKRHPVSKNMGLVFTLGPSLVCERAAQFSPKGNTWYDCNYTVSYTAEQGWGAIGRVGAYWTATN